MDQDMKTADRRGLMSQGEFAQLGDGQVAYIKVLEPGQAGDLFPGLRDIPEGINLYALHSADGTPLALTDTRSAAIAHASEGELDIASVH